MDLDAFKIICAPAWPPRVTSSLATKIQGKPDCLEARRLLWFLGPEVWNVVLTMTQTPPTPSLQGASSSCLVVVRFSVLCRITWGGDNPALVGSGASWDRQGCQRGDVWTPNGEGERKKKTDRGSERKKN